MSPLDSVVSIRLGVLTVAASFMLLEYLIGRLAHHDLHDMRETAATFGVAAGHSLIRGLEAVIIALPFMLAYEHRVFNIDAATVDGAVLLFLAIDFIYYWHHRASHHIRWLWATHSVHHSPRRMNLTAALRLGWTANISGHFLFYLPLAFLGFHPFAIVAALAANLTYQFFLHTELSPRFGPLEWILNTPTHHRVHHASDAECLDKNFGGTLILFDRLFGTFAEAPEGKPLTYGLRGGSQSHHPLRIVFSEWSAMIREVRGASKFGQKFTILFGPVTRRKAATTRPRSPENGRTIEAPSEG
ncbi:sterol desaturase family protein [Rhizobium johnstonii]|uniref:sterol desaturase family protein n=1 Tax=Rhizobium TaxID=379 RepID=UPI001030D8FF|nr:sterol desaturase family protein [Rhizobium leguminosarum]TBF83893.1 sterol desaturase family protein [Rhizobium leguminosarum]TBG69467.1 sterol desaturase family protein [Rhizobium leguminosarum]TBH03338.1 sterol desaturase family protein [Rhizobium leguminosarum]TBH12776.1 sterol desaturase family protein [Rhizobium leguminosarum]TBH37828.1 sterol desaturase family protein [Rhizobium leguminosarum]